MIGWRTIDSAPTGVWIRTKREGEKGENVCALNRDPDGNEEWVERGSGITTITHHSFAAPTHWKPL